MRMSEHEYVSTIRHVLAVIRPHLSPNWQEFVDSNSHGGEFYVALDDAVQGLSEVNKPLPPEVAEDVDRLLEFIPKDSVDYQRITMWINRLPDAA